MAKKDEDKSAVSPRKWFVTLDPEKGRGARGEDKIRDTKDEWTGFGRKDKKK